MTFIRPRAAAKLTPSEKRDLLEAYYADYRRWAEHDPTVLNRKLEREVFAGLVDRVGELLLKEAAELPLRSERVRQFFEENPLPPSLAGRLPAEFRAFCLALNALKQWVAAEQAATDRYLLGGTAREQCRTAAEYCILSGTPLTSATVELHHPVRDGRPPVPVCREAHAEVEGQVSGPGDQTLRGILLNIKRKGSRSWVQLRRGCQDLLGLPVQHSTPKVAANSRSFARRASQDSSRSYQELLDWLDANHPGLEEESPRPAQPPQP